MYKFYRLIITFFDLSLGRATDPDGPVVSDVSDEDRRQVREWLLALDIEIANISEKSIELAPNDFDELSATRHFRIAKQQGLITSTAYFDLSVDWHIIKITDEGRRFLVRP